MLVTYLTLVEPMPFFRFQDLEMPPPPLHSLHPRSHLAFASFFPFPSPSLQQISADANQFTLSFLWFGILPDGL